jgi:hypothetical protein|tara:strand:+ start:677 stop:1423 length:747 start_codon:yes stop_codon:yes gene_type:complete
MDKFSIIKIYTTTNYKQFEFIPENRYIEGKADIKVLEYFILKFNFLSIMPIVVNRKMEITDGQRRFTIAKRHGLRLSYIKSDLITRENLAAANAGSANWTILNYVEFHAKRGLHDYQLLLKFIKEYKTNPSIAIMFAKGTFSTEGSGNSKIKFGEFKFRETYAIACKKIEQVYEFGDFVKFYKNKYFIEAMNEIMANKSYDHKRMRMKFKKKAAHLVSCGGKEDFTKMLEDLYNGGLSLQNKVRFYGK